MNRRIPACLHYQRLPYCRGVGLVRLFSHDFANRKWSFSVRSIPHLKNLGLSRFYTVHFIITGEAIPQLASALVFFLLFVIWLLPISVHRLWKSIVQLVVSDWDNASTEYVSCQPCGQRQCQILKAVGAILRSFVCRPSCSESTRVCVGPLG